LVLSCWRLLVDFLFYCFVSREYSDHRLILISCFLSYCLRSARTLFLLIFLLPLSARDFRSVSCAGLRLFSPELLRLSWSAKASAFPFCVAVRPFGNFLFHSVCCSARVWPVRPSIYERAHVSVAIPARHFRSGSCAKRTEARRQSPVLSSAQLFFVC
jgi:hypothetical protein